MGFGGEVGELIVKVLGVADCPSCAEVAETEKHFFISCPKAAACWNTLGITYLVNNGVANFTIFAGYFFSVLALLSSDSKVGWCMTLWSSWEARNDCVWNNKKADANSIIWTGSSLYSDWSQAHGLGSLVGASSSSYPSPNDAAWSKPCSGSVKATLMPLSL